MKSTKEKIIEKAEELFSQRGYDTTSVSDICEEVRISKGAFFHYFPTKESLFLEILDRWLKDLNEKLEIYRKESQKIPEGIIKMGQIFKEVFKESKGKLFLFLEFLRRGSKDEKILKSLSSYYDRYKKYFSLLIEEGIKEKSLKEIDSNLISRTLISFAIGTILQEIFDPLEDWEKLSVDGIKLILSGIEKEV